ncbi:MAG TPA: TonB-dependent receptor [Bacteroidales bacterium]|nr:TonB-dependent receptor [Bacteroidales bacterium]
MNKSCLAYIFICWLFYQPLFSQEASKTVNDSTSYLNFEQTISAIELKHNVRFYFNTDNFQNKRINSSIINLSLEEALSRISTLTGYSFVKINKASYVLLPFETTVRNESTNEFIVVGNPLDYGKYTWAQVEGKVVDGKTGEPVIGAIVFNEKLKINESTDVNGNFKVRMPVGEQELTTRYYGYNDNTRKIKIYGKGNLTLELFDKVISLGEVTIKAGEGQNMVNRNQMSVVRIDAKGIKELPVTMGEIDILKSVTLMPGVQSTGEFGTGFNVRGGNADQNLVLMEDLPVFNSSHVFGLISVVNPDNVSNVTFMKAGIPAKYGERASSVFDIKMDGTAKDRVSVKGGIGLINSRLNIKLPMFNKKIVLAVGGRTSYSDWLLKSMNDLDLKKSSARFYDINALLSISPNSSNRISLFGYMSNDDFKFSATTKYGYKNFMGGAKWSHTFSNSLAMSLMAGRSKYDLGIDEDLNKPDEASSFSNNILYDCIRLNLNWNIFRENKLEFGANAVMYQNNPGELLPGSDVSVVLPQKMNKEKALELSGYISDNFSITEKFSFEMGLRFTQYRLLGPYQARYYNPESLRTIENIQEIKDFKLNETAYSSHNFEPRISMIYKLNPNQSIKASYSKINQYINLVSNTSVITPTDTWKLSDNNILPLASKQYALGYYINFSKGQLEASAEIYYKDQNNVPEYKNGAKLLLNPTLETDMINSKGSNYGLELYVSKNSGKFTGWASYTISKSVKKTTSAFKEEQISGNRYYNSNFDVPHNVVINGVFHLSKRWRISGTFLYNSGRPTTLPEQSYFVDKAQVLYYSDRNKYRMPDYHRLDLSITLDESIKIKKRWRGSWTFSIINLYGRKNAYSIFYQKEVPHLANDFRDFSLYKLYIIGRPLPTLTYNFSF